MLLAKQTEVKLPSSYWKIMYLYPAYNNTFVFMGVKELRRDCVVHVDSTGKILFEHIFPVPMDTAGMINDREFIMVETRSKWNLGPEGAEEHPTGILILDLETHKFRRTPFYFFNEETDQTYIETFAQTKYLCIREIGRYNDNRYKLSYFNYPPAADAKPFNVYESKEDEWTYEYITKQGNQHSMICWFKARHDEYWDFKTYDLRDDPKGKLNVYKIKNEIGVPYGITNIQCAMNTMWETTKNCFMLVCISNKTEQNHKNKDLDVVQNNYIFDSKTGTIREAKFSFGWYQELVIDQYNLGPVCMFRTFDFKDGEPLETPIYYINNETEEIIAQQTWKCSYLHKDEPTAVESGMIIHNQFENGDCTWFKCETIKIVGRKEIYMHMLLGLNDNFDQDLLQEAIEMLDNKGA